MKTVELALNADNRDTPPWLLGPDREGNGAWSATMNGRFINGVFNAVAGVVPVFAEAGGPAGPILFARTGIYQAAYKAIYVTAAGIGVFDGVHHDVTPATGWVAPNAYKISATMLNGLLVVNAPPNPPYYVDTVTYLPSVIIPGWASTDYCEAIVAYRYYLVACGITSGTSKFDQLVKWSDAAEPGALPATWTPAPENDAGDLILSDMPGAILAAKQMVDSVMIYKAAGTFLLQWVGGTSIMQRRFLFSNLGVVNPRAVVAMEREHVCIIPGDIVVQNGATFTSILEGRFRQWFFERVPQTLWQYVAIHYDPIRGEVWAAYPSQDSAGKLVEALVWNRYDNGLSVRQLPTCNDLYWTTVPAARKAWSTFNATAWADMSTVRWSDTAGTPSGTGVAALVAIVEGNVRVKMMDASEFTPGGLEPITASVERVGIPLGNPAQRSLVKRVRARITGTLGASLSVQVGSHEGPDDPVNWGATFPWIIGETRDVPAMAPGRYGAVRIQAEGVRFKVDGMSIEYTTQGLQ